MVKEVKSEISDSPSRKLGNQGSKAVAAGVLLSRISGLIRESLLRSLLGLTPAADAFAAALRIPNLLQNLLGEGSLSSSFIPVYSKLISEGKEKEAGKVAGSIAGLLIAVTSGLTLLAIFFAEPIAKILAPGFTSEKLDLTADLIRITTAGLGLLVLAAWCLGILNSHRRFFLSYVAPVVWNTAQIAALLIAITKNWEMDKAAKAAAFGLLVGGVLQFLFQLLGVLRLRTGIAISFTYKSFYVKEILKRFTPAILGRGVVQLSAYFDLILASMLATGAVAALMSAQVLYILPISLFALSIAAVELPEMSRDTSPHQIYNRLDSALRKICFFMLLTSAVYISIGEQIIRILFQWGSFDTDDTMVVAITLAAYSLGIPAIGAARVFQSTLYAKGDTKSPALAGSLRVVISLGVGLFLMFPLDRLFIMDGNLKQELDGMFGSWGPLTEDVRAFPQNPHLGALGLAFGSAIGSWVEMLFLSRKLKLFYNIDSKPLVTIKRLLPATTSALLLSFTLKFLISGLNTFITLVACLLIASITYCFVAYKSGIKETEVLLNYFRKISGNFKN